MKRQVLLLLSDTEGFLSEQIISEYLGISQSTVLEIIEQLKKEGYQIEAVPCKGYCLKRVLDDITSENCVPKIYTSWVGKHYEYYRQIDSTNNRGKQLGKQLGMNGAFVVADYQSGGKGRRGRVWESPFGTSLSMSLVLQPSMIPEKASMLTLVNALAVRETIEKVTGLKSSIKWPNDIVISGKKLCGILTEMSTEGRKIRYVVIGTGINVNIKEFPKEISDIATSLYKENCRGVVSSGKSLFVQREKLIVQYLESFEKYYEIFMETQDLSLLREEYETYLVSIGKEVRILDNANKEIDNIGICEGITENGDLIVTMSDGTVRQVLSGEVSVRGIYGYV